MRLLSGSVYTMMLAIALNYAAREPFPTINPALLYSGEIAMGYALSDNSSSVELFYKFFSLASHW